MKTGKSLKEDTLKKDADQIRDKLNNLEQSLGANPKLLFNAMEKAQIALLDFARSDKNPKAVDDFTYAMEGYLASVKQVGASIKKLNQP